MLLTHLSKDKIMGLNDLSRKSSSINTNTKFETISSDRFLVHDRISTVRGEIITYYQNLGYLPHTSVEPVLMFKENKHFSWLTFILILIFTGIFTGFILPVLYVIYHVLRSSNTVSVIVESTENGCIVQTSDSGLKKVFK